VLPNDARFCLQCGAALSPSPAPAEYKQVTVLFADVVRSMDIAASEGPERLREIMADLLDRSRAVVSRYGGTVDKFTGDGIMAVFGAPVSLEDHAFRACLAALEIQRTVGELLELRIGLNSGQVIAGEIGSVAGSYTTIGAQVGLAQRMESVAPPGGVMLSESTARLVEQIAVLGKPELVHIKGAQEPVPAQQLLAIGEHQPGRPTESVLVGRSWELNTITSVLDETIGGAGCVVTVVGPPGIGKSRLIREATAVAAGRGVEVIHTYCESHTRDIPFQAISRLLRAGMGVVDLDPRAARSRIHELSGDADADDDDLVLLDDLLGIREPGTALPDVAPDARRRRLTALINSASLARTEPAIFLIEDVHWIDEASESLLTNFLSVVPQTPILTLITYRPEYDGPLSRIPGAQTIALRALSGEHAATLTAQLVGSDPLVRDVAARVTERAAGNPFFAEEMVRDLAERGVLGGQPGAYSLCGDADDADVPATLHATIGARIDRLERSAKRTLNAAALIGSRFELDLLASLVDEPDVTPLIAAELIDQVRFGSNPQFAFRHPLVRAVAHESQLKSDRAQLHRRLAALIEERHPESADANAALIAEHHEAAGDLHDAYRWHMHAADWANYRDNSAAANCWRRAQRVADRMPDDDPERLAKRIESRTLQCATGFRISGSGFSAGFDELRDLCIAAGDKRSLAIAMSGPMMELSFDARRRDASALADEQVALLESIGDPTLTLAMIGAAISVKYETAEMTAMLRLSQRAIDLAAGDATKGGILATSSPLSLALAFRGFARWCLGIAGWRDDCDRAVEMAKPVETVTRAGVDWYARGVAILHGVLVPSEAMIESMTENLSKAQQAGDDTVLGLALSNLAIAMAHGSGDSRARGLEILDEVRKFAVQRRYSRTAIPIVDCLRAQDLRRRGDVDGAIDLARTMVTDLIDIGASTWVPLATAALVESLLQRGSARDLEEAQTAIDRLAAVPIDRGLVFYDVWLLRLRALTARARGDADYCDCRDRYRSKVIELGYEGHIAMAEAMD
jgi:adenylate cyclase